MNFKGKIRGYFEQYWKRNIFSKCVSLIVATCFIFNIANLPAYGQTLTDEEIRKQKEMKQGQAVLYQGHNYATVQQAVMQGDSMAVEEKDGAVRLAGNLVGTMVDGAVSTKGLGASASKLNSENLTKMLRDKVYKVAALEGVVKELGEGQGYQKENVSPTELASKVNAISKKAKISEKEVINALNKLDSAKAAATTKTAVSTVSVATENIKKAAETLTKLTNVFKPSSSGDKENKAIEAYNAAVVKSLVKKTGLSEKELSAVAVKKIAANDKEDKIGGYDASLVNNLVAQTGLTEKEVVSMLKEAEENAKATDVKEGKTIGTTFNNAMSVLKDFLAQGGEIVNCATDALAQVLGSTSKGLLALQALLVDVATGVFTKNNNNLQDNQLMTSMDAMNKVLQAYGKSSAGVAVSLDDFVAGLEDGQSGILWVNEDHFVTVTKNKDGSLSVTDPNVNDGEAVTYTQEGFKKAMSGGEAVDANGNKVKDVNGNAVKYNAVGEDGKIKTLTESKGVSEAKSAETLNETQMQDISGALRAAPSAPSPVANPGAAPSRTLTKYRSVKVGTNDAGAAIYESQAYSVPNPAYGAWVQKKEAYDAYVAEYKAWQADYKQWLTEKKAEEEKARLEAARKAKEARDKMKASAKSANKNDLANLKKESAEAQKKLKEAEDKVLKTAKELAHQQNLTGDKEGAKKTAEDVKKIHSDRKARELEAKTEYETAKKEKQSGAAVKEAKDNLDAATKATKETEQSVKEVETVANHITAQDDLAKKQQDAVKQAQSGTAAQQVDASKALKEAENTAIKAAQDLAAEQKKLGMDDEAKQTQQQVQVNVANGKYDFASAEEARAKKDFSDALKTGNIDEINKTGQNVADKSAAKGKAADEAINALKKEGYEDDAKALEDKVAESLKDTQYSGSGKNYEEKFGNDAAVQVELAKIDRYTAPANTPSSLQSSVIPVYSSGMQPEAKPDYDAEAAKTVNNLIDGLKKTGNEDKIASVTGKYQDQLEKTQDSLAAKAEEKAKKYESALDSAIAGDISSDDLKKSQDDYLDALKGLENTTKALDEIYGASNGTSDDRFAIADEQKRRSDRKAAIGDSIAKTQESINAKTIELAKTINVSAKGPDYNQQAYNTLKSLWDVVATGGKSVYDALTNLSVKLGQGLLSSLRGAADNAALARKGIEVKGNSVTQYGFDNQGMPTTRTIILDSSVVKDASAIKKAFAEGGFKGGLSYLKSSGAFSSESFNDKDGNLIYSASKAGYSPASKDKPAQMAIQYNFYENYAGDNIYFSGVKDGDKKVVVETYTEDGNAPKNTMIFNIKADSKDSVFKTEFDLDVKLQSASLESVERVLEWDKDDDGNVISTSIEFKDDLPSALVDTVISEDETGKQVVDSKIRDLTDAVTYPGKIKGGKGGSGSSDSSPIDKYKDIIKNANGLKIKTEDKDFYKAFKAVDKNHIDLSKATTLEFNNSSGSNSLVVSYTNDKGVTVRTAAGMDANGNQTGIGFGKSEAGVPDDWRSNWKVLTGDSSNASLSYTKSNGQVVEAENVKLGNDWKNDFVLSADKDSLTNSKIDSDGNKYSTKNVTVEGNDITKAKADYSDPSKNTAFIISNVTEKDEDGNPVSYTSTTHEGVAINISDNGKFSYSTNIPAGIPTVASERNYSGGTLVNGKDSYSSGSSISTAIVPRERQGKDADRIELDNSLTINFTFNDDGKFTTNTTDDLSQISGTYVHINYDNNGKKIGEAKGAIEKGGFTKQNSEGISLFEGEVNVGANAYIMPGSNDRVKAKEAAAASTAGKSKEDTTVETNAIINKNADGSISVRDGIVSIRDGSVAIIGENTIFKNGSRDDTVGGFGYLKGGSVQYVKDANGDLTYVALSEGVSATAYVTSTALSYTKTTNFYTNAAVRPETAFSNVYENGTKIDDAVKDIKEFEYIDASGTKTRSVVITRAAGVGRDITNSTDVYTFDKAGTVSIRLAMNATSVITMQNNDGNYVDVYLTKKTEGIVGSDSRALDAESMVTVINNDGSYAVAKYGDLNNAAYVASEGKHGTGSIDEMEDANYEGRKTGTANVSVDENSSDVVMLQSTKEGEPSFSMLDYDNKAGGFYFFGDNKVDGDTKNKFVVDGDIAVGVYQEKGANDSLTHFGKVDGSWQAGTVTTTDNGKKVFGVYARKETGWDKFVSFNWFGDQKQVGYSAVREIGENNKIGRELGVSEPVALAAMQHNGQVVKMYYQKDGGIYVDENEVITVKNCQYKAADGIKNVDIDLKAVLDKNTCKFNVDLVETYLITYVISKEDYEKEQKDVGSYNGGTFMVQDEDGVWQVKSGGTYLRAYNNPETMDVQYEEELTVPYDRLEDEDKIRVKNLELSDIAITGLFGDGATYYFNEIVYDTYSSQFNVSAELVVKGSNAEGITLEADSTVALGGDSSSGSGSSEKPKETLNTRYNVNAKITRTGGSSNSITLKSNDGKDFSVGVSFNLIGNSLTNKTDNKFGYFAAGTSITLLKGTQWETKYTDRLDKNRHDGSNTVITDDTAIFSVDKGDAKVFVKTNTALSALGDLVADSTNIKEGSISFTHNLTVNGAAYNIRAEMAKDTNYKDSSVVSDATGAIVDSGKVSYGGLWDWYGKVDLRNVTVKLESGGLARAVEATWGVIVSVVAFVGGLFTGFDTVSGLSEYAASLLSDKQIGDVTDKEKTSAIFAGVTAIAAVAITIATAGTATTLLGSIALAATATITAVSAAQSIFNASIAFQEGRIGEGFLNLASAAIQIAGGAFIAKGLVTSLQSITLKAIASSLLSGGISGAVGGAATAIVQLIANNGQITNWGDIAQAFATGLLLGMGNIGTITNAINTIKNTAGVFWKTALKTSLSVATNSFMIYRSLDSARHNLREGNFGAAMMDIFMAITFTVTSMTAATGSGKDTIKEVAGKPIGKASEYFGEGVKGISRAALNGETSQVMRQVFNNLTFGQKLAFSLRNGLGLGLASTLIYSSGTIAQNLMNGRPLLEGIDLKTVGIMFAGGLVAGAGLSVINPRLASVWSTKNSLGTLKGYITNPQTFIQGAMSSARSLSMFNAFGNPVFSTIGTNFNALINQIPDASSGWFYKFLGLDDEATFDYGQGVLNKYYNTFFISIDSTDAQTAWSAVRSSFGTGLVQAPFFSMAMPGKAVFNTGSKLGRIFTELGESGPLKGPLTLLAGNKEKSVWLTIAKSNVVGRLTTPVNMKVFQLAQTIFGGAGSALDYIFGSNLQYTMHDSSGNAFHAGIFQFVLGNMSMMFVPSKEAQFSIYDYQALNDVRSKTSGTRAAAEILSGNHKLSSILTDIGREMVIAEASKVFVNTAGVEVVNKILDRSVSSIRYENNTIDATEPVLMQAAVNYAANIIAANMNVGNLKGYSIYTAGKNSGDSSFYYNNILLTEEVFAKAITIKYMEAFAQGNFAGMDAIAKYIDSMSTEGMNAGNVFASKLRMINDINERLTNNEAKRKTLADEILSLEKEKASETIAEKSNWSKQKDLDQKNAEMLSLEKSIKADNAANKDAQYFMSIVNSMQDIKAQHEMITSDVNFMKLATTDGIAAGSKVRINGVMFTVTDEMINKASLFASNTIAKAGLRLAELKAAPASKTAGNITFEQYKQQKLEAALGQIESGKKLSFNTLKAVMEALVFANNAFSPSLFTGAKVVAINGFAIDGAQNHDLGRRIESMTIKSGNDRIEISQNDKIEISKDITLSDLIAMKGNIKNVKFIKFVDISAMKEGVNVSDLPSTKELNFSISGRGAIASFFVSLAAKIGIKVNSGTLNLTNFAFSTGDELALSTNSRLFNQFLKAEREFMIREEGISKEQADINISGFRDRDGGARAFVTQFAIQNKLGAFIGTALYNSMLQTYTTPGSKVELAGYDMYKYSEKLSELAEMKDEDGNYVFGGSKQASSGADKANRLNNLYKFVEAQAQEGTSTPNAQLDTILNDTGFEGNARALMDRINVLISNKDVLTAVKATEAKARQIVDSAILAINNATGTQNKTAVLDSLMTTIKNGIANNTMDGTTGAFILRRFADSALLKATGYMDPRPSQSEMVSAMLRGDNVALGMGGGKTVGATITMLIQRIMFGNAARLEILVGNSDLANYASDTKASMKLAKLVGLTMFDVGSVDYKKADGVQRVIDAYNDHNTIVVMDPTIRGHLRNQAISSGDMKLNAALNSVNVVIVDEIHLWALTRTAAVIGGDNKTPEMDIVKKANDIIEALNLKNISGNELEISNEKVTVKRYDTMQKAQSELSSTSEKIIAVVGERSADRQIIMSQAAYDIVTGVAKSNNFTTTQISSIMRGLLATSEVGGMDLGSDGAVKPVSAKGIENNMVISDIYYQLGFAFKQGLNQNYNGQTLMDFAQNITRTSNTSMQTSLAAIYDRIGANIVGMSGTVAGLEQLIINRAGSSKIYNVSGEGVSKGDFKVYGGNYMKLITDIVNNADNSKNLDNVLTLAKTNESLETIREAVRSVFDMLTKDKGYQIFEFTDRQGKWVSLDQSGREVISNTDIDGKVFTLTNVAENVKTGKRFIIANEAGATGIDYQGKFANIIFDAHLMSNTDLAQALKRSGRPDPSTGMRAQTERYVMYNDIKLTSQTEAFINNKAFVEYAMDVWSGKKARAGGDGEGYLKNDSAVARLKIARGETVGNASSLDIALKDGKLSEQDRIMLVSHIRELYDINSAMTFSVTDSMRDRMVLSPLRQLAISLPQGADKDKVMKTLNDALNRQGGEVNLLVNKVSGTDGKSSDIIKNSFDNSYREAVSVFGKLNLSNSQAKRIVSNHLADLKIADKGYTGLESDFSRGIDGARNISEFVEVMKSYTNYIMPEMSALTPKAEKLVAQAQTSVQSVINQKTSVSLENLGITPAAATVISADAKTAPVQQKAYIPAIVAVPSYNYTAKDIANVRSTAVRAAFNLGLNASPNLASKLHDTKMSLLDRNDIIHEIMQSGVNQLAAQDKTLALLAVSNTESDAARIMKSTRESKLPDEIPVSYNKTREESVAGVIDMYTRTAEDIVASILGKTVSMTFGYEDVAKIITGNNSAVSVVDVILSKISSSNLTDEEKELLKSGLNAYEKALLKPGNAQVKLDKLASDKKDVDFTIADKIRKALYERSVSKAPNNLSKSTDFTRMIANAKNSDALMALISLTPMLFNASGDLLFSNDSQIENLNTMYEKINSIKEQNVKLNWNYKFGDFVKAVKEGDYLTAFEKATRTTSDTVVKEGSKFIPAIGVGIISGIFMSPLFGVLNAVVSAAVPGLLGKITPQSKSKVQKPKWSGINVSALKSDSSFYKLIREIRALQDKKDKARTAAINEVTKDSVGDDEQTNSIMRAMAVQNPAVQQAGAITMSDLDALFANDKAGNSSEITAMILLNNSINTKEGFESLKTYHEASGEKGIDIAALDSSALVNFAVFENVFGKEEALKLDLVSMQGKTPKEILGALTKAEFVSLTGTDYLKSIKAMKYSEVVIKISENALKSYAPIANLTDTLSIETLSDKDFVEHIVSTFKTAQDKVKFDNALSGAIESIHSQNISDDEKKAKIDTLYSNIVYQQYKDKFTADMSLEGFNTNIPSEVRDAFLLHENINLTYIKGNIESLKEKKVSDSFVSKLSVNALNNEKFVQYVLAMSDIDRTAMIATPNITDAINFIYANAVNDEEKINEVKAAVNPKETVLDNQEEVIEVAELEKAPNLVLLPNLPTVKALIAGFKEAGLTGIPLITKKVSELLENTAKTADENTVLGILNNCGIKALTAMSRIRTPSDMASIIASMILDDETPASSGLYVGTLLAAGSNNSGIPLMSLDIFADVGGLVYSATDNLADLQISDTSDVVAVMHKGDSSEVHVVALEGITTDAAGNKIVSYVEDAQLKTATAEAFKNVLGFTGMLLTDKATNKSNKGILASVAASNKEVRSFLDASKLSYASVSDYKAGIEFAKTIVDGVTQPGEINPVLAYALTIWSSAGDMAARLNIDLQKDVIDAKNIDNITAAYQKAVAAVLKSDLTPGEIVVETKLLSMVRDLLIMVNKADNKQDVVSLLGKAQLNEAEFASIVTNLVISKAVNHNVLITAMDEVKTAFVEAGEEDFVIDMNKIRDALQKKETGMEKVARFFSMDTNIEDVLPKLESDTNIKKRGGMMSPMMARAFATAA